MTTRNQSFVPSGTASQHQHINASANISNPSLCRDAHDYRGDVIRSTLLVGTSNEVLHTLFGAILLDDGAQVLILHHTAKTISAEDESVALLYWLGEEVDL